MVKTVEAKLRNLTPVRTRFKVRTAVSPLAELAVTLWAVLGGDDKLDAHELDRSWFEDLAAALPEGFRERAAAFGGDRPQPWLQIASLVSVLGPGADGDELAWLEQVDLSEALPVLVSGLCFGADADTLEAAEGGDRAALTSALQTVDCCPTDGLAELLSSDGARLGGEIADVLRMATALIESSHEIDVPAVLARSAGSVDARTGILSPEQLIEDVTNGISYEIPRGTMELVLVPSVVVRPWTIVLELGSTAVVIHPVSDDDLDDDPDAPPRWLVSYHKALSDERRLRILRRLAGGEAGLGELSSLVGLAKSTVVHHVGILRSAGLVKTVIRPDGVTYSLRTSALPDARGTLDRYLMTTGDMK